MPSQTGKSATNGGITLNGRTLGAIVSAIVILVYVSKFITGVDNIITTIAQMQTHLSVVDTKQDAAEKELGNLRDRIATEEAARLQASAAAAAVARPTR